MSNETYSPNRLSFLVCPGVSIKELRFRFIKFSANGNHASGAHSEAYRLSESPITYFHSFWIAFAIDFAPRTSLSLGGEGGKERAGEKRNHFKFAGRLEMITCFDKKLYSFHVLASAEGELCLRFELPSRALQIGEKRPNRRRRSECDRTAFIKYRSEQITEISACTDV